MSKLPFIPMGGVVTVEGSSTGNVSVCLLGCHFEHDRQSTVPSSTSKSPQRERNLTALFLLPLLIDAQAPGGALTILGHVREVVVKDCTFLNSVELVGASLFPLSLRESDDAILNLIHYAAGRHSTVWWCCERAGHCGWRL
jgi:hypothetical protein